MAQSLHALTYQLLNDIDDPTGSRYTLTNVHQAVDRAMQDSWPHFYALVEDATSYTGANTIAANTSSIAVPAVFLASGETPAGCISAIWCRVWDGTQTGVSPVPQHWFLLKKTVFVESLNQASPLIRFLPVYSQKCEIRIEGAAPLTRPLYYDFTGDATTDVITAAASGGFTNGNRVVFSQLLTLGGVTANTTYYIINSSSNTFKISATPGGSAVDITTNGRGRVIVTDNAVNGTDTIAGFTAWLNHQALYYLYKSKIRASSYDRDNNLANSQIELEQAKKLKAVYRMPRPFNTIYDVYGLA